MAIFCVRDGDTAAACGFNTPLKKVERPVPKSNVPLYSPTGTAGVVLNNKTGKMETELPLPPAEPIQRIIPDSNAPLFFSQYLSDPEVKKALYEKKPWMTQDMKKANIIGKYLSQPDNRFFSDHFKSIEPQKPRVYILFSQLPAALRAWYKTNYTKIKSGSESRVKCAGRHYGIDIDDRWFEEPF